MGYNVKKYWDSVAGNMKSRQDGVEIAGDDDPYYLFKRKKFLLLFGEIPFENKAVLELGPGPGGNLDFVADRNPKKLVGVDISPNMIALASARLEGKSAELKLGDGNTIPYQDRAFDLAYTVTVLQHIVDEKMLENNIAELCRVSKQDVYIFERTEYQRIETKSNVGRIKKEYEAFFNQNNYELVETKYLNINVSNYACGAIRRLFNNKSRKEGELQNKAAIFLQRTVLPLTKILNPLLPLKRGLTMMHFQRK